MILGDHSSTNLENFSLKFMGEYDFTLPSDCLCPTAGGSPPCAIHHPPKILLAIAPGVNLVPGHFRNADTILTGNLKSQFSVFSLNLG
jgi:hypothetical protein